MTKRGHENCIYMGLEQVLLVWGFEKFPETLNRTIFHALKCNRYKTHLLPLNSTQKSCV